MKKCIIPLVMSVLLFMATLANVAAAATVSTEGTWSNFISGSSDYWVKEMANNIYSGAVSNSYANDGMPAYRIELRNSDPIVNGSKRSEIATRAADVSGGEYTYSFSILLPEGGTEDYALDPEGSEIIAQWHNMPDPGEEWTSPPLAIHTGAYHNDPDHYTLEVNYDAAPMSTNASLKRANYDLGSFAQDKGVWVDWEVHVKWGWLASQSPIIQISKNGSQIFETTQPNTTNDQQGVKMKVGVYKWDWAQNGSANASVLSDRVIYFNNISSTYGDEPAVILPSADQVAAQTVIDRITALPASITLADQSAVEEARAAYGALTATQKALVANYSRLTAAEATLKSIGADQSAAQSVSDKIDSLPTDLTLADQMAVASARKAYEALTSTQKALVMNYNQLTAAEDTIADLLLPDQAAAQSVVEQIDSLPADLTLTDQTATQAARSAYDALTDSQRALVTNYSKLTDAETAIAGLRIDQPKAQIVIDQIDGMPADITLADQASVETVRAAYDALTNSQQALVTNYSQLTLAEGIIANLAANLGDSTLSSLRLSSGSLTPQFDSDTTAYVAKVANTVSSIKVTPTANSPGAAIEVNDARVASGDATQPINLTVGANTIKVIVTAENGSSTTYSVTVTRQSTVKSGDNTLSDLTLNAGSLKPGFSSSTTQYAATVSKAVNSISLTPTVNDPSATIKVNGVTVISGQASTALTLRTGKNSIKIVVTAENGKTKTYYVTITRLR